MTSMTWLLQKRIATPGDGTRATLGAFLLAYAVATVVTPSIFQGGWNLYFAQPIVWLSLAAWCLDESPVQRPSRLIMGMAGLVALFQVAVLASAGLLFGFGESPYAHSFLAIGGNVAYLGSVLVATELVRARLLQGRLGALPVGPLLVAGLFTVSSLSLNQWQLFATGDTDSMRFTGLRLLPAAADSWTATLLSMLGGPIAAIAYRFTVMTTEWLSPMLPALSWAQAAIAACVTPAVATMVLRQATAAPTVADPTTDREQGVPLWLGVSAVVVVGLIWLNAGLFGVKPAIVSGISMNPTLVQGDIVVTKPVSAGAIRTGDVIRFREGGVAVIHRVTAVSRDRNGLLFTTQGDNNPYPDAPVSESAIEGKVVVTIPKLGLLPIAVRSLVGR